MHTFRPRIAVSLAALFLAGQAAAFAFEQKADAAGRPYKVATVNLKNDRLRLHWENPTTRVPYMTFLELSERLRKEGTPALFITNSGIYAPGYKPLGLHIENGRELVPLNFAKSGGNFAMLPNGVFWVKGGQTGIEETWAYKARRLKPDYATQSGPLLVSHGKFHPNFNAGSESRKLRSGVGICKDGKIRFVVSERPVNFYTFARFFRDDLKCPDALYLDGTISAYAAKTPGGTVNTQWAGFAGMWSVTAAH